MSALGRRCKIAWVLALAVSAPVDAQQVDIPGPAGSVSFGGAIRVLANGNIVVVDGQAAPGGAVHLYSPEGVLISSLRGGTAGDAIASGGITELTNGNFVFSSPNWDAPGLPEAGAVTWVNGVTGLSGMVSASNSLIGTGYAQITALTNGNYVVGNRYWNELRGAVTFGHGGMGSTGWISSGNSLVGSNSYDEVGSQTIVALSNGNYVVASPNWARNGAAAAGAVTAGDAATGHR